MSSVIAEGGAVGDSPLPRSQEPGGCDVFISYSRNDASVAESLAAAIEQHGPRVWAFSREGDTVIGGDWYIDYELPMLEASQVVVFLVSRSFAQSAPCQDELRFAIDPATVPRKSCFAVLIDDLDLSESKPMSNDVKYSPKRVWSLLRNFGAWPDGHIPAAEEVQIIANAALRLLQATDEGVPAPHGTQEALSAPPQLPVTERWAASGSSVLVLVDARGQGAATARRWLHREYADRIYGADSWRFSRALYLEKVKPALERLNGVAD